MLFLVGYSLFFLAIYAAILFIFLFSETQPKATEKSVAVLLAVRNEEHNLEECLKRLLNQTYKNYKILIGNDNSRDNTPKIIDEYQKKYPRKIIGYSLNNNTQAKQGVIGFLAEKAQAEILLITDADVRVPTTWIETMVGLQEKKQADLLNHPTLVQGNQFLNLWENLDWLQAVAVFFFLQKFRIPTTGMGNNMLIRKKAYEETGGYKTLPFSLTEDFELYHLFLRKKKKALWIRNRKALTQTIGNPSFRKLIEQRKRWLKGALKLPWYVHLFSLFLLSGSYVSAITTFLNLQYFPLLFSYYLLTAALFFYFNKPQKTGRKISAILLHPFYSIVLYFILFREALKPSKILWKDRTF